MKKIKIHSVRMQDLEIFNGMKDVVEFHWYDDLDKLFSANKIMPKNEYVLISVWKAYTDDQSVNYINDHLTASATNKLILMNTYEGAEPGIYDCENLGILDYVMSGRIVCINGGEMPNPIVSVNLDSYQYVSYIEHNFNLSLNNFDKIFDKKQKPYTFLYLNKVAREYRLKLIDAISKQGVLESALWSNFSAGQRLPDTYEDFFNETNKLTTENNNNWLAGLINPRLYTDTYFSVISETNFASPCRFFTEKIYKVLLIGHPFILAGGAGCYKQLRDSGYKTFDGLIDESFDSIENNDERVLAIAKSVKQLCSTDLNKFLVDARPICEHNREVYLENYGKHKLVMHNRLLNLVENKLCLD